MMLTPNSFSLNNSANPVVTTASGNVSISPGQAVLSGSGTDNDPTDPANGVGSLTLAHGLTMSGNVTVTEPDGQTKGSGTLTISPDGKTISGSTQASDGSSVSWRVTKQ